eukprot:CAMPEP_0197710754 /NCGR_PEP_ID=MMETSP1338-20131121/129114_1 /TAXON_ID=43686 ORGANISM="Pelagodinium beii, Strain RCC1491" /NCGR_SAMPLE_ID=MMETSP1338 /ASSEMBLY_ACC=CAM_ASM_000754 /LENGTH=155 /DNA_ID=CAMNT_0043294687 /DNA_START=688 /DNA_END=1154 /DNA_ORIENTATION=+
MMPSIKLTSGSELATFVLAFAPCAGALGPSRMSSMQTAASGNAQNSWSKHAVAPSKRLGQATSKKRNQKTTHVDGCMPHGPPKSTLLGVKPIGDQLDAWRRTQALEAAIQEPENGKLRKAGTEAECDVQKAADEESEGKDLLRTHEVAKQASQES